MQHFRQFVLNKKNVTLKSSPITLLHYLESSLITVVLTNDKSWLWRYQIPDDTFHILAVSLNLFESLPPFQGLKPVCPFPLCSPDYSLSMTLFFKAWRWWWSCENPSGWAAVCVKQGSAAQSDTNSRVCHIKSHSDSIFLLNVMLAIQTSATSAFLCRFLYFVYK